MDDSVCGRVFVAWCDVGVESIGCVVWLRRVGRLVFRSALRYETMYISFIGLIMHVAFRILRSHYGDDIGHSAVSCT